ncbi:hypothetical protein [Mucilaginibacter sp.]|uniref:hypothetical protein n=1 Tax=Mucilaginibacter sp. TaxID=1882438 RepID=UPI003D13C96E
MRFLLMLCILPGFIQVPQNVDISKIRGLYHSAPVVKQDARQFYQLMLGVDSSAAAPVLICYKGASEMIQAKYALNPIAKLDKFNKGKALLKKAISRDTLDLEMRFIRFSIQSNLPAFLGYHDELETDKRFLLDKTKDNKDPELKEIIYNYLSSLPIIKPEELKQLKN